VSTSAVRSEFEAFVLATEPKLRVALAALFGQDQGRDATSSALLYAWEHWDTVAAMANPAGYLYRVGRSSMRRRKEPRWLPVPASDDPIIEPGLPAALAALSDKQRLAVVMVHAYGWERREVAELTGMSISTLDTHLARGLAKLRSRLGAVADA
jgi:DNA-directed RNA polymerase specialized sigma24 family protein